MNDASTRSTTGERLSATDLDPEELRARVQSVIERDMPAARLDPLERLHGGVSSLTYRARLHTDTDAERDVVIKVAPPGLPPVRNRDVLRQAHIIRALDECSPVTVPSVLFEDRGSVDRSGDGRPPFFVMSLVEGESYEPGTDVSPAPPTPAIVDARARSAARMLAELQSMVLSDLGLDDEPVVSVEDELARWSRLLETVDPSIAPGHEELHEALADRIPSPVPPTLIHGDYRLANMQIVGARIEALIDWEIWSVGDPRTDLAWLLMHTDPAHRFHADRPMADQAAGRAMPTPAELLAEYRSVRNVHYDDLDWFLAYSHYKVASTVAVFVKRNRRSTDPDPKISVAADSLAEVVRRGVEHLGRR